MYYQSFLDHIGAQGCFPLPKFETPTGSIFKNIYTEWEAPLFKDEWVPWRYALTFCEEIGIDIPPELAHHAENFDSGWFN